MQRINSDLQSAWLEAPWLMMMHLKQGVTCRGTVLGASQGHIFTLLHSE